MANRHQLLRIPTLLTLLALPLGFAACDGELACDEPESGRVLHPEVEARAEVTTLASEAVEAELDIGLYICEYGEAPALLDACTLREEAPVAAVDDLRASAPSAADPWSCIENNACGDQTEYCFCDWACIWFGDCCYDYLYC